MSYISGIPKPRPNMDCKDPAEPGIYYHYTSLETMWAILESETLRATQARFSNDSEEIRKGVRILKELCAQEPGGPLGKYANWLRECGGEDIDCYIACFCGEDDILSQWRGYCRNDGVSIGFSFDKTHPCYFFKNAADGEQDPQAVRIFPVWYVAEEGRKHSGKKIISEQDLKDMLAKKLKEQDELSDVACKAFINATIPLIKHAGFCEEDEYRLIIRNTLPAHVGNTPFPLDKYVCYAQGDGIKNPYINISFGKNKLNDCVKKVGLYGLTKEAKTELDHSFSAISTGGGGAYQLVEETNWEGTSQIIIGPGKNQQEVFEAFDRVLTADAGREKRLFSNVKLWCEGHLPIRSITVSPCQNQKEIIESIRHYCIHQKFWMKYVKVSGSDTPYRRAK